MVTERKIKNFNRLRATDQLEFSKNNPEEMCKMLWFLLGKIDNYDPTWLYDN